MMLSHLDQVCAIEAEVYKVNYWSRQVFVDELNNDRAAYWVAISGDKQSETVLAYGGLWVVDLEAHITNLAVKESFQGKKIGEKLLLFMIEEAINWNLKHLTLEVRLNNQKAQNLYKKNGFFCSGLRPKYYSDGESAMIMWTPDIQAESFKKLIENNKSLLLSAAS